MAGWELLKTSSSSISFPISDSFHLGRILELKRPSISQNPLHLTGTRVRVLFEDEEIIVVEKPAGLLTIATEREKRNTLYALLYEYVKRKQTPGRIFIVHRLDREASGLLVFAKTEASKRELQRQFREHTAGRTYVAVLQGRVNGNRHTLKSYLAENAIHRSYSTTNRTKAKWAVTHVVVIRRSSCWTLVEVRLETGRKHQIRAHLAEQGHPVVGDQVYGSSSNPIRRLALHAVKLMFKHPLTGKSMEFRSPPPASFASLV